MQNIISVLNRYLSHINMPSVNIIDVIEILLISVFVYQFMGTRQVYPCLYSFERTSDYQRFSACGVHF